MSPIGRGGAFALPLQAIRRRKDRGRGIGVRFNRPPL